MTDSPKLECELNISDRLIANLSEPTVETSNNSAMQDYATVFIIGGLLIAAAMGAFYYPPMPK